MSSRRLGNALFGDKLYLLPEEIQSMFETAEARGIDVAGYKSRQAAVPARGEYDAWEAATAALRAKRADCEERLAGGHDRVNDRGHYDAEDDSQSPEALRVVETLAALVALYARRLAP